jgi:hypothetical protein
MPSDWRGSDDRAREGDAFEIGKAEVVIFTFDRGAGGNDMAERAHPMAKRDGRRTELE